MIRFAPQAAAGVAVALMTLITLALVGTSRAEIKVGHQVYTPSPRDTPIPFDANDFIRLTLDPMQTTIRLGEPLVFPFRLVNHTDEKVSLLTKFHPRANLKVTVQPEGERERQTFGPYLPGTYIPDDYVLYPHEERPVNFVLWGDRETPNGLTVDKPGRYRIYFELNMEAHLSNVRGVVPLVDSALRPIPYIDVTVEPPSEETAGLIEQLSALQAYPSLHLRNLQLPQTSEHIRTEIPRLLQQFPETPLKPYMEYAVANEALRDLAADPNDADAFARASEYLERAAAVDSAYRIQALTDLLRLYDGQAMGEAARLTALKLIDAAPKRTRPLYGSMELVRKYLRNSAEMDPIVYWSLQK